MMKKIIKRFNPDKGYNSNTNAIRQIFSFHGHFISEEMIFGMSEGMGFNYYGIKDEPGPVISGRIKPGAFEDNLSQNLNVKIDSHETASKKKAYKELAKLIETNEPVIVYADMGKLPYLYMPEGEHDGSHTIVVFGIDEEKNEAHISDRDDEEYKITMSKDETPAEYHIISLDDLAEARASKEKPYPARNRWLTFDFNEINEIDGKIIFGALKRIMNSLLEPQVKTMGLKGIEIFMDNLGEWKDLDDEGLRKTAFSTFYSIEEIGGTGGGCFRRLFGNFMRETAEVTQVDFLKKAGVEYVKLADDWDTVGKIMYEVYENGNKSLLDKAKSKMVIIHIRETELAMRVNEFINKANQGLA